jgi:Dolichyl-phosphate-mannose-protein mannosyltransferase
VESPNRAISKSVWTTKNELKRRVQIGLAMNHLGANRVPLLPNIHVLFDTLAGCVKLCGQAADSPQSTWKMEKVTTEINQSPLMQIADKITQILSDRNRILPVLATLILTTCQLIRLVAFINVYGGIEHDSGWMLTISRSLAEQGTYTTLISTIADPGMVGAIGVDKKFDVQATDGRIWFFTGNGIGPASIVPDALVLKLFGTDFWALRLGPLVFYTLFLLLGARLLYELAGVGAIILFHGFIFFYPQLSIFLGYEAMGEVPTICYVLLAFLAFASAAEHPEQGWRRYFIAGLFAGLAINSKLIGLLAISGLFLYALGSVLMQVLKKHHSLSASLVSPGLAMLLGTSVPLVLWELYQLLRIVQLADFATYQQHLQQRWQFVLNDGSGVGLQLHSGLDFFWDKFFILSEVAQPDRWITALVFVAILAGGIALFLRRRHQPRQRALLSVLLLGWLANTAWFAGLAQTGWVRHFWFGLVLAAFLLSAIAVGLIRPEKVARPYSSQTRLPAFIRQALAPAFGMLVLALVSWNFLRQPYGMSILVPDEMVTYWQAKQIHDPYGSSLPWIIIPRAAQDAITAYIRELPPESTLYFPGRNKAAELPPLTGHIQYPLERRKFVGPHPNDFLVIGPSIVSSWQDPQTRRKGLAAALAQCPRPVVQNDFYRLCSLPLPTDSGVPAYIPNEVQFQNGIKLLGYSAVKTTYRSGDSVQLSLFWQSDRVIADRYKVFVHLVGTQWNPQTSNPLWGQLDQEPAKGVLPTTSWLIGSIIEDAYLFPIQPDAPPGSYQIEVGMYLPATGQRVPIEDKDGTVDYVILFEVAVH